MISVQNLTIEFGGESLFDHVSLIINPKDRIGLVGKNGAGKTTLLRIIAGKLQPHEGTVLIPDACTVGYLEQEMEISSTQTVYDEARSAFHEVEQVKAQIARLEGALETRQDFQSAGYQKLVKQHHDAWERFQLIGGQTVDADIEKTLIGLGFLQEDFQILLKQFSRGWQMRVELAKILLRKPSLMMLDEPTNHLDIESIQWLESYLQDYPGAVILVSHDRAFLDNVTRRTVEITFGKIYDYQTHYSHYVDLREERLESQLAAWSNQQRQIRQIERFVERFRYKNTKARQVQSRLKMLDKLDQVTLDLIDETAIHFSFPPAPHAGKIILEAKGVGKTYGEKEVLHSLDFSIINGDRVAFVGRNGEGKTTLSRILAGELDYQGQLKWGHQVIKGYFAQNQEDYLDPDKTVFQTIDDVAKGDVRSRLRTILGSFLFSGEDQEKKVKVLSGGEKSRLALAKLLLTPANLLILDEPTNHLDMGSKDILKNALLQYSGTLIIVSHDRDFMQGLTNRVFEFRERRIRESIGDIYDFLEQRRIRTLSELESKQDQRAGAKNDQSVSENKRRYELRKIREREERKVRNQIERCEQEIAKVEHSLSEKETMLGDPATFSDHSSGDRLYREYEALKQQLDQLLNQWEKWHLELETMIRAE